MRTAGKKLLIGMAVMVAFLGLLALALCFPLGRGETMTASASTNRSKVLTVDGSFVYGSTTMTSDPDDYFKITFQSTYPSGTGTLGNNETLNWTTLTAKIEVVNQSKLHKHMAIMLTRDGIDVVKKDLSGNDNQTLFTTTLSSGNYTLTYTLDVSLLSARYKGMTYVFKFKVDITAPQVSVTTSRGVGISNGDTINQDFTYSASDINFQYIHYKKPGATSYATTINSSYSVLATAANSGTWEFYATDNYGNASSTFRVYMDCLPPTISCSSAANFGGTTGKAFTVSATDSGGTAKLYVKYESEEWFSDGSQYTVTLQARSGRYYFYAEDRFGNKSDTQWVILSTEPPVGRLIKSDSDNSVAFTWDNEYWTATLDGRAYTKGAWVVTEGNHTIILSNNAEKEQAYNFSIDHYYVAVQRQEATCSENGWEKYECLQCGGTTQTVLYSRGHQYSVQSIPASCTEEGEDTYTCTVCGETLKRWSEYPSGHELVSTVIQDATCTEEGKRHVSCIKCDYEADEVIPARGHTYSITQEVSDDQTTTRTYTCSACGDSYTQELGNQYEMVTSYVEYLFEQYRPYMVWVFLATAGVWSIAIGIAIIIATKNEDKAKAKKMLVNYLIGLVVIFAILVACPLLVNGIAALVT